MRTLLQYLDSGKAELTETPVPRAQGPTLLVETRATVVSAGTERMIVEFGRASLLEKARQQPDRVKMVLDKARTDGIGPTLDAVRSKLGAPIALGYCHAGVVVETGAGASPFAVGDRVVTNGNHAEYVTVPYTLAARIPDGVAFDAAAFTPLAAIGLQGLRLAEPTLGETIVVYGLGLIGLLTVQLVRASGCRAIGIDTSPARLALAAQMGAITVDGRNGDVAAQVRALTGGVGADAVLLTLSAASDDPVHFAAEMSRKRGRIVLVGVTGLAIKRDDFYRKELSFAVSCSYGPGRYDPAYEEQAQDYPLAFVRWTEQRNFEAVLQLMAEGKLDPAPLISHRFAFDDATKAYDLLASDAPSLGVVLEYADRGGRPIAAAARVKQVAPAAPAAPFTIGVIGAGNFATRTLIPALAGAGARKRMIASGRGMSAAVAATRLGFEVAATDLDALFGDASIDTVLVLTRHDSHARLACRALKAGKHVFVEKPLALTEAELDEVEAAAAASGRFVTVGFNRRFAPLARELRTALTGRAGPAALVLTVNAGALPRDHWTQDPNVGGGRIVGEACHFVDLARYLVGAPIVAGHAVPAADRNGQAIDDIAHLSLSFADGSTAVVHYLSNGSSSFPKERVEAFADGRVWQVDNWRRLNAWGGGKSSGGGMFAGQDKGHADEMKALAAAVRAGGPPPIPHDELFEVSRWAIRLARAARQPSGAAR